MTKIKEKPVCANLPPELRELQKKWLDAGSDRKLQDKIYATEFAPQFVKLFRELKLVGAPPDLKKPRALVSVLGLSWQPVALMAAWIQPEKMFILGTEESFRCTPIEGRDVIDVISEVSGVPCSRIEHITIPDDGELEIYREVRGFINRNNLEPRELAIDPTGGKKSMSVSAGLVGFLTGSILVYVDYGEYAGRIPLAGTEYPRLLSNPLIEFGHREYEKLKAAFRRGDYREAEDLARDLEDKLYEPRPAQAMRFLAEGYGAWNEFLFESAGKKLCELSDLLAKYAKSNRWDWASPLQNTISTHMMLLEKLSDIGKKEGSLSSVEEGMPLIINHLAAAERAFRQGRLCMAILLAYATLERYVDLCLLALHGLDDKEPDYEKISAVLDVERYHKIGGTLYQKKYRKQEPSGPLMMGNGVQLLAALNPEIMPERFLGQILGLMNARNNCPYEHGLKVKELTEEIVRKNLSIIKEIIAVRLKSDVLVKELEKYEFPDIPDLVK